MQPCQKSRGRLQFYIQDQVGYLELDNPEARNAMSINMMSSLSSIVQQIQAADISILVIRGAGTFFCAGGDLRDVRRELISGEKGKEMCSWMTMQLQRLASLPVYIIVVVEGAAIGGGAELMTVGDFVLASRSATIGFVQVSLGVTTGWGGASRLVERIGKRKTLQVLLSAQKYTAEQALTLGLIDQVCDDVDRTLERVLSEKKRLPPKCFSYAVSMIKGGCDEEKAFVSTWGSMEHRNALGMSPKN